MEHMSNIFSTSFGINFAKLTRVWLALISLTAKINSLLFMSHPVYCVSGKMWHFIFIFVSRFLSIFMISVPLETGMNTEQLQHVYLRPKGVCILPGKTVKSRPLPSVRSVELVVLHLCKKSLLMSVFSNSFPFLKKIF